MKNAVNDNLNLLLHFALQRDLLEEEDFTWAANHLMQILGLKEFSRAAEVPEPPETAAPILEELMNQAAGLGLLADSPVQRDLFDTMLMGVLTPPPSRIIRRFRELYELNPAAATDYFYDLSLASNYVRKNRTDRNVSWSCRTGPPTGQCSVAMEAHDRQPPGCGLNGPPGFYGDLAITINLAKPEKDPRNIAAAGAEPSSSYPACLLCRENEGFFGNQHHPARQNLRLIPLELGGERWFLQYSPYVYYNEHCIVLSETHRPMKIDRRTFENLFGFLDFLPHYFIGSNADLPIVGGSILSHDHYQGGRHSFPMDFAEVEKEYEIFSSVSIGRLRWPMSVLRLKGSEAKPLIEAAMTVLEAWRGWSDESVGLLARSGGRPHNTVTPIARRQDGNYVLDLVLRNNRTTAEHPFGLFHPHEDVHNIKKENIGLIEVLGLAILPPRLLRELELLKAALTAGRETVADEPELSLHSGWYPELKKNLSGLGEEETAAGLRRAVGLRFLKGLEDAGVFKRDEEGLAAFDRFAAALA